MSTNELHSFRIPVMGTGFSIDTPLKVAKYGISSVISLVDDNLIEQMRKYHCEKNGIEYFPIAKGSEDWRARRITSYLNLLDELVKMDGRRLMEGSFEKGSETSKYFELLPEGSLKQLYSRMTGLPEGKERSSLQNRLRAGMKLGSIDVNIMTKLDMVPVIKGKRLDPFYSDAVSALRGFALSRLNAAMIFSAGINPVLFDTIAGYRDFLPDRWGRLKKRIIIKVSDFRSALVQGKALARKGLWVSEFRIESGLNCGGHAFVSKGMLLGPVLEEFRKGKEMLTDAIAQSLSKSGGDLRAADTGIGITVQGGIGTADEDRFLREYYQLSGTGWGTPFMLVPEVVNISDDNLKKLAAADEKEVFLSQASPLGVLFWNLRNSASELMRKKRIASGKPGASCVNRFAAFSTEFSEVPECLSSRTYQRKKLASLIKEKLPLQIFEKHKKNLLAKACICYDLAGAATRTLGINRNAHTALTPGPNIINFSKASTLKEMVDHIYGRINLITSANRKHMFLRELELYIEQFRSRFDDLSVEGMMKEGKKQLTEFGANLLEGISYYRELAGKIASDTVENFNETLDSLKREVLKVKADLESADI